MRGVQLFVAAAMFVCGATLLFAQAVVLDGVVRQVNGDIVTRLDVRQAKLLKLVTADPWTDEAIADRLVDRRLMLADAARSPVKEPAADVVTARIKSWEATLDPGTDLPALLARAGMTEASVRAWLIDDLRVDAYVDQTTRVDAEPTPGEMLAYYQGHVSDYADGGVVKAFLTVQREVRTALRAENQARLRKAWLDGLRRRADIRIVKGG